MHDLPTGTVTFLFTDIEGSTRLWEHHPQAMEKALARHDALLSQVIESHGGTVFKKVGDAFCAAFASAPAGVAAAVAAQRSLGSEPWEIGPLRVRMALHTGTCEMRDGDYLGPPLNRVARLLGAAHGGQIVLTLVVEELIRRHPPAGVLLRDLGEHGFRDLAHPERVFQAMSADLPADFPPLRSLGEKGAAGGRSIAVLPFVNMSPDPDNEYFSDGMTEELINAFAQVQGLNVTSRTSAFAFKGKDTDVREIGRRLSVGAVLEGSVRKAGTRLRVTAQLIDTADGYHLWSDTYDRELADVFAVQDELSRAIVSTLQPRLLEGTERRAIVQPTTGDLEAYTHYLKGRFFVNQRTVEGLRAARDHFEEAVKRDSGYALAHAGLAQVHTLLGFGIFGDEPPREAMPRAKAAAAQALAIDPELPEAHAWKGAVAFLYDWDWALAEAELLRAVGLHPSTAALIWYSLLLLCTTGRQDEAIQVAIRARALDPLAPTASVNVGRCYHFARRQDEAIRELRLALEMELRHEQTYEFLARALCAKGLFREALTELEAGMLVVGRREGLLALHGRAAAAQGLRQQALEDLQELRRVGTSHASLSYFENILRLGLGEKDAFLESCEQAIEERQGMMVFLRVDPLNDGLRQDPRFVSLLQRLRLDF
jgi:TolB-like protein/class 3 adenylate cyclase/Tfp pilus assembly protein PilF